MARMPDLALDEMTVAVSEACANSALHSRSREVTIRWLASDHHVEVSVEDQGVFVRRVPGIADGECGWGIPMMMAMIDEITIREGRDHSPGTMVRLVKNAT